MSTSALSREQKKLEAEDEAAKRESEAIRKRLAKIDALINRGAGGEYLRGRPKDLAPISQTMRCIGAQDLRK